jgi:PAS domain S-box-containing protein
MTERDSTGANREELLALVRRGLDEMVAGAQDEALSLAYAFGRAAIDAGIGVVEVAEIYNAALNAMLAEAPAERIHSVTRASGRLLSEAMSPFEMSLRGVQDANSRLGKLLETADQTSARMRGIIDSALDAVITIDQTGRIVDFNPAAETMFGRARSDVVGQVMVDLLVPDKYRADHQRGFSHFLETGEAAVLGQRLELSALREDGTEFPVELTITASRIGETHLFTGFVRDTSERTQLQAQLLQAQRLESVGRLAGGIAHDFNNVLTAILGFTRIVQENLSSDDPQQANVQAIEESAVRATDLVRQLLAFGRQQVLRPEVLDLDKVVRGLMPMLGRLIGEDVTITTPRTEGLWAIEADRGQLEQVLVNLAINARDAMPRGGALTIETTNVQLDAGYAETHHEVTPGAYVMVAVSDTGTGMDASTLSHIFEPFFTTKEAGRGSGFGLATTYGTVRQSGGHIWVYSEPGRGTTFRLYFPRATEVIEERVEEPGLRPMAAPMGTETILVAEDEEILRSLIEIVLRRLGYTVLMTSGAAEALEVARSRPVDLLLTDVIMPGQSGFDLAASLRAIAPDAGILYMSGYTAAALENHGPVAEGDHLLQKPFTAASLGQAVRNALARKATRG